MAGSTTPPGDPTRHRTASAAVVDLLAERLDDTGTALEVCCGNGAYLEALTARRGCWLWAIESSPVMLAEARRRVPTAEFRQAGPDRIPYPDLGFDLVYAVDALAEIVDRPRYFAEVQRVLAPGGAVCTATRAADDDAARTVETLDADARAAGLEPLPSQVAGAHRLAWARLGDGT